MTLKRLAAIALLSGILTAYGTPGEASLITWDFRSGSSTPYTVLNSGSYGNIYTFTVDSITVTVTAWGLTGSSGTTFQTAQVARTASGLGGCNRGEGQNCTSNPRLDNVGQLEFLLFKFSSPVNGIQIVLDPAGTFDRDVSYWVGNMTAASLAGGLSQLGGLGFGSRQDVPSAGPPANSPLTLSLTSGDVTSVLFGAQAPSLTTGTELDRFFVKSLTMDPPVATPEPGTLLLLGSGLVGVAAFGRRLRKRG